MARSASGKEAVEKARKASPVWELRGTATSVDEELRTIAAGVVAMANSR